MHPIIVLTMKVLAVDPDEHACEQRTTITTKHDTSSQRCCPESANDFISNPKVPVSLRCNPQKYVVPILWNISVRQKKPARTFRCMATVQEETDHDIEQEGNSSIPHDLTRAKATASNLAMSIINNNKKRKSVDVSVSVEYIVTLLRHGNQREKEIAACALHRLSAHEKNRSVIAQKGGIPPLLDLIRNGTALQKNQAAAAIAGLAVRNDSNKLLIARAGGISPLLKLTRNGTDKQKSLAVRALYCLAKDEGIRNEIYLRGGIEPIIELVAKNDTLPDLKRYASAALRLFDTQDRQ